MQIISFVFFSCLLVGMASSTVHADKKLIEFGWDEPDTQFMREHVAEMERTPFDGCVFHVNYKSGDDTGSFTWECWGKKKFTQEQLQHAIDNLQNTPFEQFTHNFLRFNVTPGDVDWFDDFSAVLHNAKLAARIAKQGKVKGILFDIEQYQSALFNYSEQKVSSKSWDEYAKQVRKRGHELIEAFQSEYPDITIFLTFGYCLPWLQAKKEKGKLSEAHYGLLAPLLNGMVDAANEDATIVDGHELSYGYKDPGLFSKAYKTMESELLPIVANPAKYRTVFSFGFGIWMDKDWRQRGWNTEDFSKNYFSPEEFQASVEAALSASDEYVWIYTEQPRWWSSEGEPVKLPEEYVQAVSQAKK